MKILFVCRANAGRSQVAKALFDKLSQHSSESAGIQVEALVAREKPSTRTVKHATSGQPVIDYMRGEGIDVSDNIRSQLTPEMVDESDRVVVITAKETWPEYLAKSEKVVFWNIPNAVGMSPENARIVYDQVKKHVKELVTEIG